MNSSKGKYIMDDSIDTDNNESRDKFMQSSSLGRTEKKTSTFAENYFRQKKRNKQKA
jgi:hypothetical protein